MSPRPRRVTSKAPKIELVYEHSSALEREIAELVTQFPARFGWTKNFRLAGVIVRGGKPGATRTDVIGRFRKTPPVYHGLTGYDAVVEVAGWWWDSATLEQRSALVAHELCHGDMSEKGTLRLVKHDLEEFVFVVRQWGAWRSEVKLFGEQLEAFAELGSITRAVVVEEPPLRPRGRVAPPDSAPGPIQ